MVHDDVIIDLGHHGSEIHGGPLCRRHGDDQVTGMEWAAEGEATPSQQDELQGKERPIKYR